MQLMFTETPCFGKNKRTQNITQNTQKYTLRRATKVTISKYCGWCRQKKPALRMFFLAGVTETNDAHLQRAALSGRGSTGNDTEIGSIWTLSILMRCRCMRILLWWLLCDGIICCPLHAVDGSPLSMKNLQRCSPRIDPVHLICATQPGVSHTSPKHVKLEGGLS